MNIELLKQEISKIDNCILLDEIKTYIQDVIQTNLEKTENFMFRDYIDEYLYQIYFEDGARSIQFTGRKAYDMFVNNDRAIKIVAKTKNLHYKEEILMEKKKTA